MVFVSSAPLKTPYLAGTGIFFWEAMKLQTRLLLG